MWHGRQVKSRVAEKHILAVGVRWWFAVDRFRPIRNRAYEVESILEMVGFGGGAERQRWGNAIGENEGARLNRVGAEFTLVVNTSQCAGNISRQSGMIIAGVVKAFVVVHGSFAVSR